MINKKILIIGGTGALGKTLIKKYQESNEIMVLSRDEHKQVNLKKESWLRVQKVKFKIGDIKESESIRDAIEEYKPEVVINAAAIKHVPVCEENPYESVKVNIIGHQNLIEQIKRSSHTIQTLVFVSTDKACSPVNVYGMSKGIAEQMYVNFAKEQTDIKVALCRYGNVLDLTGYTVAGQIRKTYSSSTAVDFTAAVSQATNGVVTISLSSGQTGGMKAGRYVYDVEVTSSESQVTSIIEGQVEINLKITEGN